jgi:DNA-binding NarL/FixJ family response regulator
MSIRAVVADDQPVICAGFAALLAAQSDIEVVGTARDGRELLDLVSREEPDVAVVDVRMPTMDGIEATARITEQWTTKVLVLTTFDLDEYVYDALRSGASGFLLKDVTGDRLVEGVRLVAEGSMLLGPSVTRRLVEDFARPRVRPGEPVQLGTLSTREREILSCLARGLSNSEIAGELFIGVETVKSHVSEVLRKLGLRDRVQAVVYAHEHGLVRRGRAEQGPGG